MKSLIALLLFCVFACNAKFLVVRTGPKKEFSYFPMHYNCVQLNVVADTDLYIALTNNYNLQEADYYMIHLSSKENGTSYIQKGPRDVLRVEKNGKVVDNSSQTFYVSVGDCDGTITVHKNLPKFNKTLLEMIDENFQQKFYFGLASEGGNSAVWTFDLDYSQNCITSL